MAVKLPKKEDQQKSKETAETAKKTEEAGPVVLVLSRKFEGFSSLALGLNNRYVKGESYVVTEKQAATMLELEDEGRKVFFVKGTEPDDKEAVKGPVNLVTLTPKKPKAKKAAPVEDGDEGEEKPTITVESSAPAEGEPGNDLTLTDLNPGSDPALDAAADETVTGEKPEDL